MRKVQAMGKLGGRKSNNLEKGTSHGRDSVQKTGLVFIPPSVVEQNVKQKPEMDLAELRKTASLDQVTNLMKELKQQDVCHMEVDLAEVMWQE